MRVHACMHTHAYTGLRELAHDGVRIYVCMCMHVYACTCIRMHMHAGLRELAHDGVYPRLPRATALLRWPTARPDVRESQGQG